MQTIERERIDEILSPYENQEEVKLPHSRRLSVGPSAEGGGFEFSNNGTSWPMTTDAVYDTVGFVPGMSKAAIREWPADMSMGVINWWLQNGSESDRVRLLIDDGQVTGLPGPGNMLRPSAMIDAIVDSHPGSIGDGIDFESVIVSGGNVDLALVSQNLTHMVGGTDLVYGGVNLRFRPDGVGKVEIAPYLFREICSNGMGTRHGFAERRLGGYDSSDEVYDFLSDSGEGIWEHVETALTTLDSLKDIEVTADNLGALVTDMMRQGQIPARMRSQILEAVAVENDGTMYGVAQGFARAALVEGLSPSQVNRLRMASGEPLSAVEHCGACARPVGARRRGAVSVS